MQLTGDRFTSETAVHGNDLATLPNFPAEIRAPQGTLPGVSSFQLHFADHDVLTPGDEPDVLVAMNPAALKANLARRAARGDDHRRHRRVLQAQPRQGRVCRLPSRRRLARQSWHVHPVPLTSMTVEALADYDLSRKDKERAKNMFALGLLSWMYTRPLEATAKLPPPQVRAKPEILAANITALHAGWNYGETTEDFAHPTKSSPPPWRPAPTAMSPATPRWPTASSPAPTRRPAAWCSAATRSPRPPTSCTTLSGPQALRRDMTVQAEDEIAGVGIALGASFGGALGVTSTSGPGLALKAETIGLAVMRSNSRWSSSTSSAAARRPACPPRPSRPTSSRRCTAAMARPRAGHRPALTRRTASTPRVEAVRIATTYRTPVVLLSDGYLANGSEPWRLPDVADLPDLTRGVRDRAQWDRRPRALPSSTPTCPRPGDPRPAVGHPRHARPGAPHRRHREGRRHRHHLLRPRQPRADDRTCASKVDGIAATIPPLVVDDPTGDADVLVLGWGSTYGPI
jgi:2-oxoglutarate ferredoxin oxidoreductase subunit alpha